MARMWTRPQCVAHQADLKEPPMYSAQTQNSEKAMRIVVLDASGPAMQRLSTLLPGIEGYRLHHQRQLSGLRRLLSLAPVELAFLHCDHSMSTCRRSVEILRSLAPELPIIVLAAGMNDQQGELLQAIGASDYLPLEQLSRPLLKRTVHYVIRHEKQSRQLKQLRHHDPLTRISNRTSFYRALNAQLDSPTPQPPMALLTIDIDGFTRLNHNLGPRGGDAIVLMLSKRLQQALLPTEQLARIGTDEFAMLIQPRGGEDIYQYTKTRAAQLLNLLTPPYRYNGHDTMAHCSIGVAMVPEHGERGDDIIRRASLARFRAKKTHGCSYTLFDESLETHISNAPSAMEAEMFTALRANQFTLYYQPRVELSTGRIIGAEALIRWLHPKKGLIMPDAFIPLAEESGLIVPIGYWAVHSAGISLMKLRAQGLLHGRVGVNLSFRQFKDEQLAATITRIIEQQQIATCALEFELTESALIKDERHVRACIEQLNALGIAFSLDDFGTGYSSFALLQKLPIHTLKIDRSFISNVHCNPDDAEIVRAIINLAHNLEKAVIAEGVETREQLDFLQAHGCDQVQGYYYSRPIPFEDFEQMLRDNQQTLGSATPDAAYCDN